MNERASTVERCIKVLLAMLTSHIRTLVALLMNQLSAYTSGKATESGPSFGVPAIHVGDSQGVPGSDLATAAI